MWNKFIRIFGIFIIVSFSVFSVTIYQFQELIGNMDLPLNVKEILSYPSHIEDRFYDLRMKFTLPEKVDDKRTILAAIDEKSLKEIGRWPWSRETWAKIVYKLGAFGAKVVVFDVIFSEPEVACNAASPDLLLKQAFRDFQSKEGHSIIIPYSLTTVSSYDDSISFSEVPPDLYDFMVNTKSEGDGAQLIPHRVQSTTFPIPEFLDSSIGLAYIEGEEDHDGVFRRYRMLVNVDELYFPSLSLLAYEKYTEDRPTLEFASGHSKLKVKNGVINLNIEGQTKIRFIGGENAFPQISLYDILSGDVNDITIHEKLNNKLVFIGSTAFGAHDLRHTPIDPKLPGVYFHMNVVKMLLDGRYFQPPENSLLWSWGILVIGTLLMILISLFKHVVLDVLFIILFCGGVFYYDTFYLIPKGYHLTFIFSLFSVLGTFIWNTLVNFYLANKDKRFLKNAFGSYISPELIETMYKSGEPPKLGGVSDILTAYFTDIQGFSTFSEKLSATQLVELLNEYLTGMTDILLEEKGTLDKYEGDAIIAFLGAPLKLEDHAIRACSVALKMQEELIKLRKKWKGEGKKWPEIVHNMRMRIGINSGEIVTGNMGSKGRMNYTMMGDAVNLAARLESSSKQYGIFVHVAKATKELTGDNFIFRELDTIKVVGKTEPVTTYDLLGIKNSIAKHLLNLQESFHQGLKAYKAQKWDEAINFFKKSLEFEYLRYPDLREAPNPSKIYIERCQQFKENPPPADWNGVFSLTSK